MLKFLLFTASLSNKFLLVPYKAVRVPVPNPHRKQGTQVHAAPAWNMHHLETKAAALAFFPAEQRTESPKTVLTPFLAIHGIYH